MNEAPSNPSVWVDQYGNPIEPSSFAAPYQEQQNENITKYQLERFEDLVIIQRMLRGETFNPDKKVWEVVGDPMMNERGIREMSVFIMQGKNVLLSNYDKKTLYLTIRALLNTMTRMIYNNHLSYDIKDTALADTIMDICFDQMQGTFRSSMDDKMRSYFQKQIRESHSYIQQPQMQQKKRFGFI